MHYGTRVRVHVASVLLLLCVRSHAALVGSSRSATLLRRSASHRAAVRHAPVVNGEISLDDPRLVQVSLDRNTGIDFGCDLSLRWPYVMNLVQGGSAQLSGEIFVGDQLLQVADESVVGEEIGKVMEKMAAVKGAEIELLFFRSTRGQLLELCTSSDEAPATVSITVQEPGKPDIQFDIPYGAPAPAHARVGLSTS